jgi:hypothetical protein
LDDENIIQGRPSISTGDEASARPNEADTERETAPEGGKLRRFLHPLLAAWRSQPVPGEEGFWNELREDGLANSTGWLEIDLWGYARLLIKRLLAGKEVKELEEIVNKCELFYLT